MSGASAEVMDDHAALCARDFHGHGTHCAGTVGGKQVGAAKRAQVIAVKIVHGWAAWSDVAKAYEYVIHQQTVVHPNTRALISMSISSTDDTSSDSFLVRRAISKVLNNEGARIGVGLFAATQPLFDVGGIVTIVAAGNAGENACDYFPSQVADALTVGATDYSDRMASFSNRGACVDIFAPGTATLRHDPTEISPVFLGSASPCHPTRVPCTVLYFVRMLSGR